jgi:hypothetical protein
LRYYIGPESKVWLTDFRDTLQLLKLIVRIADDASDFEDDHRHDAPNIYAADPTTRKVFLTFARADDVSYRTETASPNLSQTLEAISDLLLNREGYLTRSQLPQQTYNEGLSDLLKLLLHLLSTQFSSPDIEPPDAETHEFAGLWQRIAAVIYASIISGQFPDAMWVLE